MHNLKDRINGFQVVEKVRAYEKRGIVMGMLIALAVVALVTVAIVKYLWLKKQFDGLAYDLDDLYDDEDFEDDDDDCCEDGCCSAKHKNQEVN